MNFIILIRFFAFETWVFQLNLGHSLSCPCVVIIYLISNNCDVHHIHTMYILYVVSDFVQWLPTLNYFRFSVSISKNTYFFRTVTFFYNKSNFNKVSVIVLVGIYIKWYSYISQCTDGRLNNQWPEFI